MKINPSKTSIVMTITLIYIVLQPILDLLTSLSLRLRGQDFTTGLLIRLTFLVFMGLYAMFYSKGVRNYFLLMAGFFIIHLLINQHMKPIFSVSVEVKYIVKLVYFNVALLFSFVLFSREGGIRRHKAIDVIVIAMTLMGVIMIVSGLTCTAFNSYSWGKEGHVGWFYAGNEIGAIMAMGFPIVVLAALQKTNWAWISVLLVIYSLFALGTKVGFGAIVIVLLLALLMSLFGLVKNRSGWIRPIMLMALFAGASCYFPFSSIARNMNMHLNLVEANQSQAVEEAKSETPGNTGTAVVQMENLVLSGREHFLSVQKQYFSEAPITQKLFGMGYGGNYPQQPKLIEMDFYDVFYSLGIFGFILYFIPLAWILVQTVRYALRYLPESFTIGNVLIAAGAVLGLGIAFTAGHVLTAPGVSIYLALLLAFLMTNLKEQTEDRR
ncbi:O-antigen ligase family protein [Bacillus salipaludis]|uniref:O-antigen ligase family protein n=1 Tax=Bacillus salipaludis TaxID=2547811 RepID=A0AA90TRW4_9BACI|nr:O-antigen ligase family protein [Bacillus salipaludis]MDQ6600361.1 O-antigen ligase family protein [Bacillus salipaludis]